MSKKRNVVLITFDSVRADHCSFMGYHRKTTPTIDKMAKKGVYFENIFASGPGTPVSLTGIFTGGYSNTSGTNPSKWKKLLKQRVTLAQILSNEGYSTGAFNPNPFVSSYFGFNKGFQYFQDFVFTNKNFFSKIYSKIFEKVVKSEKRGRFSTYLRNIKNLILKEEIFKTWENFYDDIIKWINTTKEPFFLWILLLDTHHPYLSPRKYRQWSTLIDMWYYNYKLQKEKWRPSFSEEEKQKLINAYDDSIYYSDSFIKNLLSDLDIYDPIIIFHADHGEAFGEHDNIYGHSPYLYREFLHVPLVIYNIDFKKKIKRHTSLLGLASTILELTDCRTNKILMSRNLLEENTYPWVISKVYIDTAKKWRISIIFENWKYITGQKSEPELYNLKKDPNERENIANDNTDITKELEKLLSISLKKEKELYHLIKVSRTIGAR